MENMSFEPGVEERRKIMDGDSGDEGNDEKNTAVLGIAAVDRPAPIGVARGAVGTPAPPRVEKNS